MVFGFNLSDGRQGLFPITETWGLRILFELDVEEVFDPRLAINIKMQKIAYFYCLATYSNILFIRNSRTTLFESIQQNRIVLHLFTKVSKL